VTNGYLDEVDVKHIRQWERDFLNYLAAQRPQVLEAIRTRKELTDAITADLRGAIEAFQQVFVAQ
jgi:F-type H+-transporting ATPase subunit alpha